MKSLSFRVLVLLAAFGIGIMAAYLAGRLSPADLAVPQVEQIVIPAPRSYPVSETGGIEVIANKMSASQGSMIEFTVINHNIKPATYWSFSGSDITPSLRHDGKDVFVYFCGSGQKPYTLAAGKSLVFTVSEHRFTTDREALEGKFRAGFALSFIQGDHVYYWSNEFELDK